MIEGKAERSGRRAAALMVAAIMLALGGGCESADSAGEEEVRGFEKWCLNQGLARGSDAFDACVAQQRQRLDFTRQQIKLRQGG